jgi:hypothetical protein
MNKLLAKVDSEKVADDRIAALVKQYPDFKFGKKRGPGETRTEIQVQGARTGVNFSETVLSDMKRVAQGITVTPPQKAKTPAAVAASTKVAPQEAPRPVAEAPKEAPKAQEFVEKK